MRVVYLSPVPWHSIAQRPHFFVKEALKNNVSSVLWIEPTPSRLPRLNDFRVNKKSVEADSFEIPDQVTVLKLNIVPVEPLGRIYDLINKQVISTALHKIKEYINNDDKATLVIGKPSRFSLQVISLGIFNRIIFDVMDDFPNFFRGLSYKSMSSLHRNVIERSDICFFSSHNLKNKYASLANKSELILNACDEDFYFNCQKIRNNRLEATVSKRTFGYLGSIAEWFDWDCIINLAKNNPKDQFLIVGPVYYKNIPVLPSNIEIKKAVSHDEVPKLLTSFDFGLIPFKKNELTYSVDPVKYYEYLAAGCTVISSRFGEMHRRIENKNVLSFECDVNMHIERENPTTWSVRFNDAWKYFS